MIVIWLLPSTGGEAQKLFAYRAERVAALPNGTLLLIANNTLWQYDGTGEPRMLGEEGGMNSKPVFVPLEA